MRLLLICGIALSLLSCSRTNNSCDNYTDATIQWTGNLGADGCDWTIMIKDQFYHPDHLPEKFKKENKAVKVCYSISTEKFYCGLLPSALSVMNVKDIKE